MLLNIKSKLKKCLQLFFYSVVLLGCTAGSNCQQGRTQSMAQPLLKFQKTPCYGPCPAYEATIMEDGSITFIGWSNVPVEDSIQLCLSKQELQQLKTDIAALPYATMPTSYLSQWTDIPSTYLTFYENGKEVKRIKHQEGGPKALLQLQESLDKKIMALVEQKVKQPK